MNISLFGWLDRIPLWRNLPYPTKSALLRAMKAALSVFVGILVAAATQGILFPAEVSPMVVLVITSVLQAVDKFLREHADAKDTAQFLGEDNTTDVIDTDDLDKSPPSND